ncbi:hypothetical protein DRE_02142 [Drechslerella stenobrocha 248]|uniref:Uncharacterized protein n=1 Tax=Drechslerella stenobrocha 248 TaxID=1043628 RepID=W7I7R4_9PEZI|nr:hypothetical protein DRE_02142 [Drechslerella stenobrocha 248]
MAPRTDVTILYLLLTSQLLGLTSAWWESWAVGGGSLWFGSRLRKYAARTRETTRYGECVRTTSTSFYTPMDAAIIWNRPDEPAAEAIAFYLTRNCDTRTVKSVPKLSAIMVLDRNRIRGLHLATFRALRQLAPRVKARVLSLPVNSFHGVRVADEVAPGRPLAGIPAEELAGSVVYWDEAGVRRVWRQGVQWENAAQYEGLQEKGMIQLFLREVVEAAANPEQAGRGDGLVMAKVNFAAGVTATGFDFPPPKPGENLRLDRELERGFGEEAEPPTINLVDDNLNLQPQGTPLADGAEQWTVELPSHAAIELAPDIIQPSSVDLFPSQPAPDITDTLSTELDRIINLSLAEAKALEPTNSAFGISALQQLQQLWDSEPDKDAYYDVVQADTKRGIGELLLYRDIYRRHEEARQGLPPGALGPPTQNPYALVIKQALLPGLVTLFDAQPNKLLSVKSMELKQLWSVSTLAVMKYWYAWWKSASLEPGRPGQLARLDQGSYTVPREQQERDDRGLTHDQSRQRLQADTLSNPDDFVDLATTWAQTSDVDPTALLQRQPQQPQEAFDLPSLGDQHAETDDSLQLLPLLNSQIRLADDIVNFDAPASLGSTSSLASREDFGFLQNNGARDLYPTIPLNLDVDAAGRRTIEDGKYPIWLTLSSHRPETQLKTSRKGKRISRFRTGGHGNSGMCSRGRIKL